LNMIYILFIMIRAVRMNNPAIKGKKKKLKMLKKCYEFNFG
jgi:hypothetical protein